MNKVERSEIVDYETYADRREAMRSEAMAAKALRRIHVGDNLTFLFENRLTIRYQVQEMMRAEQIVREKDIQHELDTYNELLGQDGSIGCTLLIELEDPELRKAKLTAWLDLLDHLYARLRDGRRVRPTYDPRQVGDDRLSSVQYLKFDVGGEAPVALGADLDDLTAETELTDQQRAALGDDLGACRPTAL